MPGLDKSRIVGLSDEELDEFTCSICLSIFINPIVTQCCRQTYCDDCIKEWVSQHKTCPNDRKTLTMRGLRPVPRVMINLLDNMKIKCDYESDGCPQVVKMRDLCKHLTVCDYRPNQLCKTCGLIREFVSTHNCFQSLITEKEKLEVKYLSLVKEKSELLSDKEENHQIITSLINDITELKNNQEQIEKLKSEHTNTVDQIKSSFVITFENERKTHQNELANLRGSYDNTIKIVSQLECQLSDYCSKLDKSEDKCRRLERVNEELNRKLNSIKTSIDETICSMRNERDHIINNNQRTVDNLTSNIQMLMVQNFNPTINKEFE